MVYVIVLTIFGEKLIVQNVLTILIKVQIAQIVLFILI